MDVSQNAALTELECSINRLAELDVTHNPELKQLYCNAIPTLTAVRLIKDQAYHTLSYQTASVTTYRVNRETAVAEVAPLVEPSHPEVADVDVKNLPDFAQAAPVRSMSTAAPETKEKKAQPATHTRTAREIFFDEEYRREEARKAEEAKRVAEESRRASIRSYNGIVSVPDAEFKTFLVQSFDTDGNGEISGAEARAVTSMDCSGLNLSSVEGLEYFTSLEELKCQDNRITTLDMSYFPALRSLDCARNKLHYLNVKANPKLVDLECSDNNLINLDVSRNPALRTLGCNSIRLIRLDVTKNPELEALKCGNNHLAELNIANNRRLDTLNCSKNKLKLLTVSHLDGLNYLDCSGNQLTAIDVSRNKKLGTLDCGMNALSKVDVSKNLALADFACNGNLLDDLDVAINTELISLNCANNRLTQLDVSRNAALKRLRCMGNRLTVVDVRKNLKLKFLESAPMPTLETLYCPQEVIYSKLAYPIMSKVVYK